jgi:hypothetical protein
VTVEPPFQRTIASVHNAWCVAAEGSVIVCTTRAVAERVAELLERNGMADSPWELPPLITTDDLAEDEPTPMHRPWWCRVLESLVRR